MESLFFLEEQIQNGLTFRLGQQKTGGDFLHWEPLTALPRGNEAIAFRDSLALRKEIFSKSGTVRGILPLAGPVAFQEKIWLGFEARSGLNVFEMDRNRVSLAQLIQGLTPLIHSYASCHQHGVSAGRPDWGRFYYDEAGFFTPDPLAGTYLPSPPCNPPAGFVACYPPEIYRGEKYGPPGDLFFLGLILYFVITGALPYQLRMSWPNENILSGAVVPPAFHRPELNPRLGELMVNLLAVDPARRPPAAWVAEVWSEILNMEEYSITEKEARSRVQASRRSWRKQKCGRMIQKLWSPIQRRAWLVVGVLVLLSGLVYGMSQIRGKSGEMAPQEFVRSFYEKAAVISGPVLGIINEEDPAGLLKDFEVARKERLKIISEVLSRPLAKVDKMRVVKAGPKRVSIEVNLTWWHWDGAGWKRSKRQEVLVMERVKTAWQVTERNKISPK